MTTGQSADNGATDDTEFKKILSHLSRSNLIKSKQSLGEHLKRPSICWRIVAVIMLGLGGYFNNSEKVLWPCLFFLAFSVIYIIIFICEEWESFAKISRNLGNHFPLIFTKTTTRSSPICSEILYAPFRELISNEKKEDDLLVELKKLVLQI